jgi:hypothetical protein
VLARWRTTCTETGEPFQFVAITDWQSFQAPLNKPGIGDGKPNRRAAGRAGYAREKQEGGMMASELKAELTAAASYARDPMAPLGMLTCDDLQR